MGVGHDADDADTDALPSPSKAGWNTSPVDLDSLLMGDEREAEKFPRMGDVSWSVADLRYNTFLLLLIFCCIYLFYLFPNIYFNPTTSLPFLPSPGDVLYTPPGWWHHVTSKTPSVSVLAPFGKVLVLFNVFYLVNIFSSFFHIC